MFIKFNLKRYFEEILAEHWLSISFTSIYSLYDAKIYHIIWVQISQRILTTFVGVVAFCYQHHTSVLMECHNSHKRSQSLFIKHRFEIRWWDYWFCIFLAHWNKGLGWHNGLGCLQIWLCYLQGPGLESHLWPVEFCTCRKVSPLNNQTPTLRSVPCAPIN